MGDAVRQGKDQAPSDSRRAACAAAFFRATAGGYVYRAPNPRVFGRAKHYMVGDAEREAILDVLAPAAPSQAAYLAKVLALAGIGVIGLSLATSICALYAAAVPAAAHAVTVLWAVLVPAVLAFLGATHRLAILQLRQLQPILAHATATDNRISNADVLWSLQTTGDHRNKRWPRIIGGAVGALLAAAFLGAAVVSWPQQGNLLAYAQPAFLAVVAGLVLLRAVLAAFRTATLAGYDARTLDRGLTRLTYGASAAFFLFAMGHGVLRLAGAIEPDYAGMRARAELAAAHGDAEAMGRLGWLYWQGKSVARDYATAQAWYERAAAAGNSGAMVTLAVFYESGLAAARDYDGARRWFERAAAAGSANAMDWLGWNSQNGLGVVKDYDAARQWYEKAAAADYALAEHHLGMLFYDGWGVQQDYAQARAWLLKAASSGLSVSMDELGVMSLNGFGTPKDVRAARGWYAKASSAGSLSGMQHLASVLDKGEGGPADPARAAQLLLASAKLGHGWSRTVLQGPLTFLTPDTRRALKGELARLGQYSGDVDDSWDESARLAYRSYLSDPAGHRNL